MAIVVLFQECLMQYPVLPTLAKSITCYKFMIHIIIQEEKYNYYTNAYTRITNKLVSLY